MRLRHSPGSPFVRKVMVVAHEHGLADHIEIVPTSVSPLRANAELARDNPLMKVPALTTDDGQVLLDSPVICEYLDGLGAGRKLFPPPSPARWTALTQQAIADGVTEAVILCRYETLRPEDKRWSGWTDGQMQKARGGLAALDLQGLAGAPTIGHIAIACALGYLDFRFPDEGWRQRHPKLATWYHDFEQTPSMRATKPPPA
jgi:glutathione S-transferase